MRNFRLLNRTRQTTEYSCGAAALRAVLHYWGKDVEENELMRLLGTTSEVGTYPREIVRVAKSLGLTADAKENVSVRELAQFTADGHPVIVVGQAWRTDAQSTTPPKEDWGDGHYVVVLGVDDRYVYFQDPFLAMAKGFAPHKAFEEHWHQIMGGEETDNPKLLHLAIFVRGDKPARPKSVSSGTASLPDFGRMGSLNLLSVHFDGYLMPFDFLEELRDLWPQKQIRPSGFIFLRRDKQGNLTGLEGGGLQDEEDATAINAVIAAAASARIDGTLPIKAAIEQATRAAVEGDFGLSVENIEAIGKDLPPDHSALFALFENLWERRFRETAKKFNGIVMNQRFVSPETMVSAAGQLTAKAKAKRTPAARLSA